MRKTPISVEQMREYLKYDPITGVITWIKIRSTKKPGMRAGAIGRDGYEYIGFDNLKIASHIVAWILYYGEYPTKSIDHINGICHDNRLANLRLASVRENQQNCARHRAGRLPGATYRGPGKWDAQIRINGKKTYLGLFPTEKAAHEAYMKKVQEVDNVG